MSHRNSQDIPSQIETASEEGDHGEDGAERAQSNRSSIAHPYSGTFLQDFSFARCHVTQTPAGKGESYTRSMYMLGHGTALWEPIGEIHISGRTPKPSLEIGDVGILTQEGVFEYYFNIFHPPTAEIQRTCPPDMIPLQPPLQCAEVTTKPNHLPPGTILTTTGVEALQLSASPLDVKFTVKGREGAALVLPNGITREDLADTSRVRAYVRMHLLKWYRFLNESSIGRISFPNGSMYLVTGHDKADAWGLTCGPLAYNRTGTDMNVWYQADQTPVWQRFRGMTGKSSKPSDTVKMRALFLRGMKLAVSSRDWIKYILRDDIPELPFYNVMASPVLGPRARYQTFKEQRLHFPERYLSEGTKFIFHPLEIVLRYIIDESPASDVAVVDDWVWCTVADQSDGSLSQVARLLLRILETHEIVMEDGLATLKPAAPKQTENLPINGFRYFVFRIPHLLKHKYEERRRRSNIIHKIGKIFPGPPVPVEQLQDPN